MRIAGNYVMLAPLYLTTAGFILFAVGTRTILLLKGIHAAPWDTFVLSKEFRMVRKHGQK